MVDKSAREETLSGRAGRQVGIFVKEPLPGQVKTRLSPPLTGNEAAAFYRVAQKETIHRLTTGPWAVTLVFAGARAYFQERFPQLPLLAQGEGDLGQRLQSAFSVLQKSEIPTVMIGSDSPDLPLSLVEAAFAALTEVDAVVAPAADGGYVLIGGRRSLPQLFAGIPWSSAEVLACTRRRAVESGLSWRELPAWEDVDNFSSLRSLLKRSPASASATFVRNHLGHYFPGASGQP